ncbi:MAG TPA: cupredoxin family copper-binding protein [Xanthobacteraceae bacterium]|nr:cupredoxin family copper-binding protein [Xanthobacteraceae bacterium]
MFKAAFKFAGKLILAAVLGAAAAPILARAVLPLHAQAAPGAIVIDNFTFSPPRLLVKTGTTVTWTNRDDIPHAVAAVSKLFRSKALDTDEAYSFIFTAPGTYEYFCSLHPRMTAVIVVEAASDDAAGH